MENTITTSTGSYPMFAASSSTVLICPTYTTKNVVVNTKRATYPKKVIFNPPATIVYWEDGTKTVVKCGENDSWDDEKGFAMCCAKKLMGNEGHYYEYIKKHVPQTDKPSQATTRVINTIIDYFLKKYGGKDAKENTNKDITRDSDDINWSCDGDCCNTYSVGEEFDGRGVCRD